MIRCRTIERVLRKHHALPVVVKAHVRLSDALEYENKSFYYFVVFLVLYNMQVI